MLLELVISADLASEFKEGILDALAAEAALHRSISSKEVNHDTTD